MKITKEMQSVAADILTQFMFADSIEDALDVWNNIYEKYGLCNDPFTGVPCTPEEYYESQLEYDRQTMIEKYGHCDGLE